jgi:HEAT repeat protein
MSKRTYVVIAIACLLVAAGMVVAHVQRAKKTAELLADLDTDSSSIAVDTLHELKKRGRGIEADLLLRLNSDRRNERMRAALLLGEVGTARKSGPPLAALLQDEWGPVRRAAATSLGALGYGGAVTPLLAVVPNAQESLDTRCLAVRALSLIALRGGMDAPERDLCVGPLAKILRSRPPLTAEQTEALAKARADAKKRRENAALEAAGRVVKEEKKPKEKPKEKPKLAPGEVAPEVPTDTDIELRVDSVLALGLLNTPGALEPLLEATDEAREPAPAVRKAACLALEDLPDVPRDDVLKVKMGQALLRALEDGSPDVRMTAARALARHADFGNPGLDSSINERLQYLARELTQYGEPAYWVRAAARTACSNRHLTVEAAPATENASS